MLHTLSNTETIRKEDLASIKSSLEALYSRTEGWRLFNRFSWNSKCHEFVIENDHLQGRKQRVVVCVHFDTTVTQTHADHLRKFSKRVSQGASDILRKILVVDDHALPERLPADVELISIGDLLKVKIRATEPKLVA